MNEIEIRVFDMSAVLKPSDAFALVLEELGGGFRKLALIIGKQEAQAIKMGQMVPPAVACGLQAATNAAIRPCPTVRPGLACGVAWPHAGRCACALGKSSFIVGFYMKSLLVH